MDDLPPAADRIWGCSGIHGRNLDFGLTPDLPRHWHGGDPYITHFFNGLSLMFPEGERFFMDTVRHFQDRITDPQLREDVRGFLGQEGIHCREHRRYNDMLAAQWYPVEAIEGFVRLGIMVAWLFPCAWQLALTCALEHFTAAFTDGVLRDPRMLRDAHPAFARLWRWHALEETEHKSVAFDVYQTISPGLTGYLRRVLVMMFTTVGFAVQVLVHQSWLLHHDGMLWRVRARRRARRYLWKDPGLLRGGLQHYLSYYRRDFHPWQLDNSDLVERWKSHYAA
jgi:predicted metal-dependent hydrolase